jgi:hypothetical protein
LPPFSLAFFDDVHEFNAREKNAGAAKLPEAEHRPGSALNGAVVLLNDFVQALDRAHWPARCFVPARSLV